MNTIIFLDFFEIGTHPTQINLDRHLSCTQMYKSTKYPGKRNICIKPAKLYFPLIPKKRNPRTKTPWIKTMSKWIEFYKTHTKVVKVNLVYTKKYYIYGEYEFFYLLKFS